jgi:peptidoglycan/LPS O-acetylase OafA/YrhL
MGLNTSEAPGQSGGLIYLRQLDAVRAFAVLLVVWHHWFGPVEWPLGPIGVWIFFVISGFLISRILLAARGQGRGDGRALVNFYMRRVLRIFPLYYFVLLVGLLFSASLRSSWAWYVSHLQNFFMIRTEDEAHVFGTHLWTLAVEQQFYLVWPALVLFLGRRWVLPAMCCCVLVGIASRMICIARGWSAFGAYAFTPSNLDMLALGGVLACLVTWWPGRMVTVRRVALAAAVAALLVQAPVHSTAWKFAWMAMPTGLMAVWVISHISVGIRGWIGRLFSFGPSIYLGKISYGIYVYHYFVPGVMKGLLERWGVADKSVLYGITCFVVTVAVSSLSWFCMERPINGLKTRFGVVGKIEGR